MKRLNRLEKCILLFLGAKDCEPIPTPLHLSDGILLLLKTNPGLSRSLGYHRARNGSYDAAVEKSLSALESAGLVRRQVPRRRAAAPAYPS